MRTDSFFCLYGYINAIAGIAVLKLVEDGNAVKNGIDELCGNIEGFKSPLTAEAGEDWH
ncbi:BQ2448_2104 [Microbotryum intermedium]|uniref:BQ2448_2104 protein n=1 Tax=Microbotryum intermedium TaxID=269621 RepID=A0A238FB13_9BASI|nr:BQ2448_2104 [Microbotryum intermedium]